MLNTKKFISYLEKNTQINAGLRKIILRVLDYAEEFRLTLAEAKDLLKRLFDGVYGISAADIDTLERAV